MKTAKLIGMALVLALLSSIPSFADFPLTVKDDSGYSITLKAKPTRILSVILFGDEILTSLVAKDRFVGISTFSTDPTYSNIAKQASEFKNKFQFTVESAIALKPDIVFVANWSDAAKVDQVRKAGINVYLVQTPTSISAIEATISKFGLIVGEEAKAKALIKTMEDRLAKLAQTLSKVKTKLTTIDYNSWGTSNGAGSSWDEVVNKAGLLNAIAGDRVDEWGQVAVSKELIVQRNPDLLVISGDELANPKEVADAKKQVLSDPSLSTLKAVKNSRIVAVPERLKTTTSQYIVDSMEFLARQTYPELFK